jgi:hypothetical protein
VAIINSRDCSGSTEPGTRMASGPVLGREQHRKIYKFDFFLDEACLLINCSFHTVLLKGISILEHSVLQRKFSMVAIY